MYKPKKNRRNYIAKPKVSKKLIISSIASVMAVTIATSLVWHAMNVSVPVEAQNTLSGVPEALKDHGSGKSFTILNIVPGTANDELPLGTIGYLTSGQSQLEKRLTQIFNTNAASNNHVFREETANELSGTADLSGEDEYVYHYEESITGGSGWIKIFDGDPIVVGGDVSFSSIKSDLYTTFVNGIAKDVGENAGAYRDVSDISMVKRTMKVATEKASFNLANEPLYEGYLLSGEPELIENIDEADLDIDTIIYSIDDDGNYINCGTIGNIVARRSAWEQYEKACIKYEEDSANYDQAWKEYEEKHAKWVEQQGDGEDNGDGGDEGDGTEGDDGKGNTKPTDPPTTEPTDPPTTEPTDPPTTEPTNPPTTEPTDPPTTEPTDPPTTEPTDSPTTELTEPTAAELDSASLGWIKFIGDDIVEASDEATPSLSGEEESETPQETLTDEPTPPEPLGQEPPTPPDEPKPGDCEYYTAEFTYEIVEGDEPRDDFFIPDDVEEITYEEPEVALMSDIDTYAVSPDRELVYVGQGNGNWTIEMVGNKADKENLLLYNAPTYFRCYSEDMIKEHVFCDNGININIVVKSANEVSVEDVLNADLVYLEDASGRKISDVSYITSNNDMSASVVSAIIDRAVNELMPVIVDFPVSYGGGKLDSDDSGMYNSTNYQKLASILMITDLYAYYQDMEENIDNILINVSPEEYEKKYNDAHHFVNGNIYVVDSSNPDTKLSRGRFILPIDAGGFDEVQSAIDMENQRYNNGNPEIGPLSMALAVQYIINYANGFVGEFRDFAILELQPDAGESDLHIHENSKNNTILYWKKPGSSGSGQQLIRSSKLINISVDTESVVQFSGEQADINDKYQMVFIGLDGQSLNYSGKDTVYNDESLNGKVYIGVGDIADESGQRYEATDITPQKKEALLEFLRAGYPVVVENSFFVNKTAKGTGEIDTGYIDSSSQMYAFLVSALSDDSCRDALYTISDTRSNYSDFVARINVHRPAIAFDWDNAASALNANTIQQEQIVQTIAGDAEGKYRGYIPYKVTDDEGDSYSGGIETQFYLDMNQDGRFDDVYERVTDGVAISNGMLVVEFETPERGSIPWKLEIYDSGNDCRRASLTGYFHISQTSQMPVRIVQVMGDAEGWEDANSNLEFAYEMANDTETPALLGYYLKNAELLTNMKFEIESMTVSKLAAELALNSRYLSGVDVLVLGFGPECNLDVPVATPNPLGNSVKDYVNNYISEGRGVLVSSTAPIGINGMQLEYSAVGLKDIRTYNRLGKDKSSVTYYKYATLKPAMFDEEWNLLSAEKVNDGAVSHYPYEVDAKVSLNNSISIPDYVLDLYDNGSSSSDVTAWYCLSDSMIFNDMESSYGVSPKDAANNYYLYSKGNVVYVGESKYPYIYGVGTIPDDSVQGAVNCKLFVNALMEAYNVGIKNPKVSIVAGLSDDAAETDSICVPYDEQIKEIEETEGAVDSNGILDNTVDVYFKVSEPNFAFRKDVTIAFYYEDNIAGVPTDVGGKIVNVTQFASEIWTVEQNQLVPVTVTSGLDLAPGKVYKIKAPVISLKNDDNCVYADIYIVVQSHFIKLGQDRHPIGSDSVTLDRAQLFLLE